MNNLTKLLDFFTENKNVIFKSTVYFIFLMFVFNTLSRITSYSLDSDEIFSVNWSSMCSYQDLVNSNCHDNGNPPLHFLLLKFWFSIFGVSDFSARSFSTMAGIGSFFLLLWITTKHLRFSKFQTIILLTLFSFSFFLRHYFINARAYPFLVLLSLSTFEYIFYLVGDFQDKPNKIKSFLRDFLGIISIVAGLYVHYSFIFFLFFLTISLFVVLIKKKNILMKIAKRFFIAFLCFLPWVVVFVNDYFFIEGNRYEFWQTSTSWPEISGWMLIFSNGVLSLSSFSVIAFFLILFFVWFRSDRKSDLKYQILIIFFLILFFSYAFSPINKYLSLPRYYLFLIPLFHLFFLSALSSLQKKVIVKVMILFFLFFFIIKTNFIYYLAKENWKNAIEEIPLAKNPDAVILVDAEWFIPVVDYYYKGELQIACIEELALDGANCLLKFDKNTFEQEYFQKVYYIDFYEKQDYIDYLQSLYNERSNKAFLPMNVRYYEY